MRRDYVEISSYPPCRIAASSKFQQNIQPIYGGMPLCVHVWAESGVENPFSNVCWAFLPKQRLNETLIYRVTIVLLLLFRQISKF